MLQAIEIDQSGKMERLTVDTALAFSDGIARSILVPATAKRTVYQALKEKGVKPKLISVRMFAAGLFLLLEEHLKDLGEVVIDLEYDGWDNEIRSLLLGKIWQRVPNFPKENIVFHQIGKAVHNLAWSTYRKQREPDKCVAAKELLKFC